MNIYKKLRAKFYRETETHTAEGKEKVDSVPLEMPVGFTRPKSLEQMLAEALHRRDIIERQRARGEESLEDSMDFGDDDEDDLPVTPYEVKAMVEERVNEDVVNALTERERKKRDAAAAKPAADPAAAPADPGPK